MAKDKEPTPDVRAPVPPTPAAPPVTSPPVAPRAAADPRDEEIGLLKEQLEQQSRQLTELFGMIKSGSVNVVEASQEKRSRDEFELLKAHIDKGKERITQEECDRQFGFGRFRFRCALPDGNGHPQIVVSADNEVDARARYLAVCGVKGTDKEVSVTRA